MKTDCVGGRCSDCTDTKSGIYQSKHMSGPSFFKMSVRRSVLTSIGVALAVAGTVLAFGVAVFSKYPDMMEHVLSPEIVLFTFGVALAEQLHFRGHYRKLAKKLRVGEVLAFRFSIVLAMAVYISSLIIRL